MYNLSNNSSREGEIYCTICKDPNKNVGYLCYTIEEEDSGFEIINVNGGGGEVDIETVEIVNGNTVRLDNNSNIPLLV